MDGQLTILSIEDSHRDYELLKELIEEDIDSPIHMTRVETKDAIISSLKSVTYDIILCDFKLPGFDAFGALEIVMEISPNVPFICVSGSIGEETAIELLKKGATDYVLKDRPDRLPFSIKRALQEVSSLIEVKKAENELRASEQKFRDIFHKHSAIKMIVDPYNLDIIEFNEAAEKFYGWDSSELRNMKLSDINVTYNSEELKKQIATAINNHKFNYEVKHKQSDGSIADVSVYASKLTINNKDYLHSIVYDISDKILAQEQVKLLNRAVEQSSVSVMITDQNGIIEYVNPYFIKTTGYSTDEVLGTTPRFLNTGFQSREFYHNMWETILSGKDWIGEFKNKKKDGNTYWEAAVISPILDSNGTITHFVSIKEDITQRKEMVKELIVAKEKAEESDKLKTAFINTISHEIRTPLNGILGFVELITSEESTGIKDDMLSMVQQSSDRLLNTVTDYLDIAMIMSGNLALNKVDFEFDVFLQEITDQANSLYTKKDNLIFHTNFPHEISNATLNSDPEILSKIIYKLIDNAYKFTKEGTIVFGVEVNTDNIEFYIRDTGTGINKDKLQTIFELFNYEEVAMTRGYEGSGLGLTIAKGLVKVLDGEIKVTSKKGEGSVFSFILPLSKPIVTRKAQDEMKNPSISRSLKKPLILIAEDDELNYHYLETILELLNYDKIRAVNGVEAVDLCKHNPNISLVFMDIKMPVMNGAEATRIIRGIKPDLPIIATTAYAQMGDEHRIMKAGCNDYIPKPIVKEKVISLIRKYIE